MKIGFITLAIAAAPFLLLTIVGLYVRHKTGRGSKHWPWLALAVILSTGCQTVEQQPKLKKPPVEFTAR